MATGGEQPRTLKERAMDHLRQQGITRLTELADIGIPSVIMRRLLQDGLVTNPAKGIYAVRELEPDPRQPYAAEALSASDHGILCLSSAAYLQNLLARDPRTAWVALPKNAWLPVPAGTGLAVRGVRWACVEEWAGIIGPTPQAPAMSEVEIAGRRFRVTSPARTAADMVAYRGAAGISEADAAEVVSKVLACGVPADEVMAHAEAIGVGRHMGEMVGALAIAGRGT